MNKKGINIKSLIFLLLLTIATLFMGIGYAAINSIIMNIEGTLVAEAQEGVFITDVVYKENNNANVEGSKINNYYQTMLNSSISLSESNIDSSITYTVTIYNKTDDIAYFNDVVYVEDVYSNENITYTLNGIESGDAVNPNEYIVFDITFKYNENIADISKIEHTLNSYLNFKFRAQTTTYAISEDDFTVGSTMQEKDSAAYYDERNVTGVTFSYNENGFYLKDTSTNNNYWIHYRNLSFTTGHKYYASCEVRSVKAGFRIGFARYAGTEGYWDEGYTETTTTGDEYITLSTYYEREAGDGINSIELGSPRTATTETYVRNLMLVDLTEIFGAENEPTQEWCDENLKYGVTEVKWYSAE